MHAQRIAVAVIATAALTVPAVAGAHPWQTVWHPGILHAGAATHRVHDIGRRHHRVKRTAHVVNGPAATAPNAPAATHVPAIMEADDNDCTADNVVTFLQAHQATVLRLVITPAFYTNWGPCIAAAEQAGYKVYLAVRYDAGAPVGQTLDYFRQVIATYGPVWAMSVGNEEGVGGDFNTKAPAPAEYLDTWDAVEPVIASLSPGTIRVVGEADPWGAPWTADVLAANPVGAQAASFHCYDTGPNTGLSDVPALAADAAQDGLPLYCSEMSPRTTVTGFPAVTQQTVAQWQANDQQTWNQSPDVTMQAWYEWPSIGAITPGIDQEG